MEEPAHGVGTRSAELARHAVEHDFGGFDRVALDMLLISSKPGPFARGCATLQFQNGERGGNSAIRRDRTPVLRSADGR